MYIVTKYRDAQVNGHWTRVRVTGRDFESAAGRVAARSVGRRPSAVVSVRDDGYRAGAGIVTSYYYVAVATGPRRHGLTPIVTVRVAVDTTGGYTVRGEE
jgi:hypothetical protein